MPDKHALFSPSSANRWLYCPGSLKASEGIPDRSTPFSSEGTEAHHLAEVKLKTSFGMKSDEDEDSNKTYPQEMEDCTDDYVAYVHEKYEEARKLCSDPAILVEQHVNAASYDKDLFGTTDAAIIADRHLTIIDLKYGKGVEVNAEHNIQEMIYAICCLETFGYLYDIREVELCIFQPRLSNISEWTVSVGELYRWAEDVLRPGIRKIHDGVEEFHPSKYCQFCKAKPLCKALRDKNMELARLEFRPGFLMSDDEVEEVLANADGFTSWINSVKEYALDDAIHGKKYKSFKLVEGRSTRRYSDEAQVAAVVRDAGYNPYENRLLNITAMQAMLGKEKFKELLSSLVVKPRGKLTLVSRDDRRPEVSPVEEDFRQDINE